MAGKDTHAQYNSSHPKNGKKAHHHRTPLQKYLAKQGIEIRISKKEQMERATRKWQREHCDEITRERLIDQGIIHPQ
jgi:hypothetical protein